MTFADGTHHGVNGKSRGFDRRKLPHNASVEASVLGGVILHNEVLAELADLEVDDFYDMKHKVVFSAMRALEHAGSPIDVVTLEVEIERQEKLDAIGGIAFLGELALKVPIVANVLKYAEELRRDARNRRAILMLASALERAQAGVLEPEEMISEIAGELQRLESDRPRDDDRAGKARWAIPMVEFLGDEEPDDDDAVDWIVRDLVPRSEPVIWGGPLKAGKTWAVMDLCIAIALGEGWLGRFENTLGEGARVMCLFLEDNRRRISKRMHELARSRGRDLLRDPALQRNLFITRSSLRLPDAKDQRAIIKEIKRTGTRLVVVDNLTRVIVGDPNSTRDAAMFTRAWTEIGEESGASVMFLHHTKKPSGDKEVDPFDQLRGSADFGAAARNMVVAMPLRLERGLCAEVRMRGNLDLRVDSFVLGFERWADERWNGRHAAKLVDLGDVDAVKGEAKKERKESKEREKREGNIAKVEQRRQFVLALAHESKDGTVSQNAAAERLGVSANTLKPTFVGLVRDELLRELGKGRGYQLVDFAPAEQADRQDRQGNLL